MVEKQISITIDLETDHAGRIKSNYCGWHKANIEELLSILKKYEIKLSVFVQGEGLEINRHKEIIETFKNYGAEFHLHSFTHILSYEHEKNEITKGKEAFYNFFGYYPKGYRFPEGRVSQEGLRFLKKEKFIFDSSFMPTLLRNPKQLFTSPIDPQSEDIKEIPPTVLFKIMPLSLSWMKLVGFNMYLLIFSVYSKFRRKEQFVFIFHLHDLFISNKQNLSIFWKTIYKIRQKQGLNYLDKFLKYLSKNNYQFKFISDFL